MFATSEQFITQVKFRELRAQRDKSLAAYAVLQRELAGAMDDGQRVRVLYEGLRRLRFAKQPMHSNVANLEVLLRDLDLEQGKASAEVLAFWRAELERELARGRMRAEIVYTFGALLEERAVPRNLAGGGKARQEEMRGILLNQLLQPKENATAGAFVATLFADAGIDAQELGEHMRKAVDATVVASVKRATPKRFGIADKSELEHVLERIRADR